MAFWMVSKDVYVLVSFVLDFQDVLFFVACLSPCPHLSLNIMQESFASKINRSWVQGRNMIMTLDISVQVMDCGVDIS